MFGRENELGSMFNVDVINYADWKLDTVSESQNFLGIDRSGLIEDLDKICQLRTPSNVVLLTSFDIALAYVSFIDRKFIWDFLHGSFKKRPKALIFAIPTNADRLLPEEASRAHWQSAGRLASLINWRPPGESAYDPAYQ